MQKEIEKILNEINALPDDDAVEAQRDIIRTLFKEDLFLFLKYGLGYSDIEWPTHGEMITCLEGNHKFKLIVVPRDCFKSSIAMVGYPLWRLINDPNLSIMLDSEVFENSKTYLSEIKGHMKNELLVDLFGDFETRGKVWQESRVTIAQRTKNIKEASLTCSGIGATKVGQHYKLIIGDDYNSPKNSDTKEKCQKVIDHVKYNLSILDTKEGEYVIIGTRYAELDVIGWVLKEQLGLKDLAEGKLPKDASQVS